MSSASATAACFSDSGLRVELRLAVHRVDERDDVVQPIDPPQHFVRDDRLQDRHRIGEPGRLDDDAG